MRRRKAAALGVAVLACVAGTAISTTVSHAATSAGSAVVKTKTITRDNLDNGKNHVVDKRTVSLRVSQTADLRGRQEISVSWSGAHPTGGIVSDQNSIGAQQEEYPFVLLECRGVDSTKVKASRQVSPQTCWTQDWSERYQDTFGSTFPPYRLDRYATTADRAQVAGAPKTLPTACKFLPAPTQRWLSFVAAGGHVYRNGPAGCAGQPPESQSVGGSAMPSNETFGVTGLDGRGSAKFDVWTAAENASLGCSQTVACSLVAVPIMGISCDPAAQSLPAADQPSAAELPDVTSACEATGAFAPGQVVQPLGDDDLAVSGSLWWSASNWRNRISVPLTFAVPGDACDVVSANSSVQVYGSELMIQAAGQWEPHFCLNKKLFKFTHVQLGEPEARNLVATGGADAAFTSDPQTGGYGKPVVNAPVAATGFAISYVVDGTNGQPVTKLRLSPLLLAKLLTESYPAEVPIKDEFAALANNPLNISLDPQFQALNPQVGEVAGSASASAAALLTLSSDSDVMTSLTTYINDDPTARAWLNGKADPYGMVVNPAYKGIKLPVDRWPLLSKFEPKAYYASGNNDCLLNSPVPYLPLVAAPMARLAQISLSMQFAIAASTINCSQIDGTSVGEKLVPLGRQTIGRRFMIGVTSLGDDHRFQLQSAALQSTAGHYVAPTDASMKAALAFAKPDKKTGTWPLPYEKLRTSPKAAGAYPGTMLVYAAVPTTGLPKTAAADYASLLTYAVTSGQKPGSKVGQLPPGYLPLTAANGLSGLANYTVAAANAVADQKGAQPSLTGPWTSPTATKTPSPPPTSPSTSMIDPGTPGTTAPVTVPPVSSAPSSSPASPVVAPTTTTTPVSLGKTLIIGLGGGGFAVVAILALALLAAIVAPTTYLVGRKQGRW